MKCTIVAVDGVENFRDLGGYVGRDGKILECGKFFRCAKLNDISPQGREAFNKLDMEYIIDLRSKDEIKKHPDNLEDLVDVKYSSIPFTDNLFSSIASGVASFAFTLEDMYRDILTNYKERIKKVFEILSTSDGGVVFHCTAGKDRTGITTMLIYGVAGVSEDDIAEDYSYSEKLLKNLDRGGMIIPKHILKTKPETMKATINFLNAEYGGIIPYLESIGVTKEQQGLVCDKLGVPRP